jgi:hypothetical protein
MKFIRCKVIVKLKILQEREVKDMLGYGTG